MLFPLGMLLYGSFWTARPGFPGALTLNNYIKAYTSLETYQVLCTTVLLVGGQDAWSPWRWRRRWRGSSPAPIRRSAGTLEVLITLPFFIPGLLEAIAWIKLLSPNAGTINVWLRSLGLSRRRSTSTAWAA